MLHQRILNQVLGSRSTFAQVSPAPCSFVYEFRSLGNRVGDSFPAILQPEAVGGGAAAVIPQGPGRFLRGSGRGSRET